MTEDIEKTIGQLCRDAADKAASSVGEICREQGPDVSAIVLMSAASSLLAVAAQTIVRNKTSQHPAPTDPEVVKLYRAWVWEMLRFPDGPRIARNMTAIREDFYAGMLADLPDANAMFKFAIAMASFTDPREVSDPLEEIGLFARMIDQAKAIVGDYSTEQEGED